MAKNLAVDAYQNSTGTLYGPRKEVTDKQKKEIGRYGGMEIRK